jgi:hypothetical protein
VDAIETFKHDGLTVKIYQDGEGASPAEWDNLGTLVAFPRMWNEYRIAERESTGTEDDAIDRGGFALLARYLRMAENATAVPFRFEDYGSSGARLHATDEGDDNPSGFIVTTPDRIRELCGDDPKFHATEWAQDALRGELDVWGQYVEGDVYGYVIERNGVEVDSLWGLYGIEDAIEEAKRAATFEKGWEEEQVRLIANAMAL